jgi:hypothetical protein
VIGRIVIWGFIAFIIATMVLAIRMQWSEREQLPVSQSERR